MKLTVSLFVIIFQGTHAAGVRQLKKLDGTLNLSPFVNSLRPACLTDTSTLLCEFNVDTLCAYRPVDNALWKNASGYADHQKWHASVRNERTATPPALAIQLNNQHVAKLSSDPIACMLSSGEVVFSFWATQNVKLKVCLIKAASHIVSCSDEYSQTSNDYPGFFTYRVQGPIDEPFTIEYSAWAVHGYGFLFLDDIAFFSDLCENAAGKCNNNVQPPVPSPVAKTTTTTTTMLPPPSFKPNVCANVPCDFEKGECLYEHSGHVRFERRNSKYNLEYRYFDIQTADGLGYFMSALLTINSEEFAVLSSPEFAPSNGKLALKFFRAAAGLTLKICFDTATYVYTFGNAESHSACRKIIGELDSNALKWNTIDVVIPPDATKFHLVAASEIIKTNRGSAPVAIDAITVYNC